jgi:hypothetical protein
MAGWKTLPVAAIGAQFGEGVFQSRCDQGRGTKRSRRLKRALFIALRDGQAKRSKALPGNANIACRGPCLFIFGLRLHWRCY